jgi:hypothetical protein
MGILSESEGIQIQTNVTAKMVKEKAMKALQNVDFQDFFEGAGGFADGSAGAALRAAIAETAAEYAMGAVDMARKRRIRLGAAAVVLATRRRKLGGLIPI